MATPTLFLKPFDGQFDRDDLQSLLDWPESGQVEFKEDIPEKNGKQDAWHDGKDYASFGRDKLFKEIVAFANTSGGHLVPGIKESREKPPVAEAINPIPRCIELAERLSRPATQVIDPPIRGLLIRGIQLNPDGCGIVLFRVPESAAAPHRAPDLHAYVRRNTDSSPMSMREIQDVTLANRARGERIEERFQEASCKFRALFGGIQKTAQPAIGFRITAVPASPLLLPRLFGRNGLIVESARFIVLIGQQRYDASGAEIRQTRALLRGSENFYSNSDNGVACRIYQDGSVEFEFGKASQSKLYIGWIIGNLVRVAKTIENIRSLGTAPDLEYSVEVEIATNERFFGAASIQDWDTSFGDGLWTLSPMPLKLPRLSLGPISEINSFLTQAHTDIFDSCETCRVEPIEVRLNID